jgi:PAS domain S-box-containing protein
MPSKKPFTNKNLNPKNIYELKRLLLDKYQNIIGEHEDTQLSIEEIVEYVVHYYESIIYCMPGNVYWLDKHGTALGCNKNVLNMFGLKSLTQFKNLTFEEMGKIGSWSLEATQSFKKDTLEVTYTGKAKLNIEEPIIPNSDGKLIHFLTSRVPLFDNVGSVIAIVGISIDITDRKNMEKALQEAKEKADAANNAKTEFLKNMRHDIRTPLSGIVGFAELLNNENNKERIKEFTDGLIQSSKELLRFLNEVLESINVASGEIPLLKQTFNLKNKLTDVIKLYRPKAFEKGLNLDFIFDEAIPKYVIGDPVRIYRIVLELVGNALKFTKQGHVKVYAKLAKQHESKLVIRLEVEDTGPGIPEEKKQELFIRFKRLIPSYGGVYQGSGLGLFIAKQFIDDLDGEIYIESNINKGTKFICLIPMRGSLIDEYFAEEMSMVDHVFFDKELINLLPPSSDNLKLEGRILIVEDQTQSAIVVKNILNNFGCHVSVAKDGETAIELFKNNHYDLILMDIGLPDINGYEVTKQIRLYEKEMSCNQVPIVALTAHFSAEEKQRCLEVSMNAIFIKPLLKEKMIDILKVFVPKHAIKEETFIV